MASVSFILSFPHQEDLKLHLKGSSSLFSPLINFYDDERSDFQQAASLYLSFLHSLPAWRGNILFLFHSLTPVYVHEKERDGVFLHPDSKKDSAHKKTH